MTDNSSVVTVPAVLADGLYFNLPESTYHADPALGSGSIRALAKCPIYYWAESDMNPFRTERTETPALLFGRALHALVLEGVDEFKRRFTVAPRAADYPEHLDSAVQMRAALKERGEKVSGTKPEMTERLRSADPAIKLFADVEAAFAQRVSAEGLTLLSQKDYDRVIAGAAFILEDPRAGQVLGGGLSEVSMFWTVDGVRCKSRLDKLKVSKVGERTVGLICDLKSFGNELEMPPERAVLRSIATTRLDVQACSYLDGAARIPEFLSAGKVYGLKGVAKPFLKALAEIKPSDWAFYWVFFEKDMPVTVLRSVSAGSQVIEAARNDVDRALQSYRDYMERFGTAWKFVDPIPDTEVAITDLPAYIYATK